METQKNKYSGILISDFTIDNLASYLNNFAQGSIIEAKVSEFGQVVQALLDERLWSLHPDYSIIWTFPEAVSGSFAKLTNYEVVNVKEIFKEIDLFCGLIKNASRFVKKAVFLPTWVVPSSYQWLGMLDMKHNIGVSNVLMQMNLRLSENLDKEQNVYILNTQRWIDAAGGDKAFNPKMWYLGKIAFINEVFKAAANDVVSALEGISGNSKKLIIVDLDETLWGGIVGDLGWQNIVLGGHDPVGEAFLDFQKALKALKNRGILLGIVSKNDESIAKEAIEQNSEMALRLNDFAGWQINWLAKAHNIKALAEELNIGLQSVVFIDDNPVERAQIRDLLPEVLVPEWPEDKLLFKKALNELNCFNNPVFSKEDAMRTKMYVQDRKRKESKKEITDVEQWLNTLGTIVEVGGISSDNKSRIIQLLNKTNQMNLSTRRMTEDELSAWLDTGKRKLWAFRVSDKLGDSGLTGIVSLDIRDNKAQIIDFILSCRVMGRRIEKSMISFIFEYAKKIGVVAIFAEYIPTAKNKPCLEFWEDESGFKKIKENVFELETDKTYSLPECIKLKPVE